MDDRKLDITLLCGGISAEREVSLQTGTQIAEALRTVGHRVWQSDISPGDLRALDRRPCDLIFPALHGAFGEDGQLQKILEHRGIPFVGSGEAASRLGMDKAATKSCLLEHGVPTAAWQVVYQHKFRDDWTAATGIGYPCVIKPISEGSSVGCKVCMNLEQARAHLAATLPRFGAMLVERFVEGFELTVGILDGETLPVIWIKPAMEFYDYEAKYTREDTQYVFDIPLPGHVLETVRKASEATHRFVGCRHLSRVDVMVDRRTHDVFVLEVNTMPGFTTHSLVPKAAAQAGIAFTVLCDRLARLALRDAAVGAPLNLRNTDGWSLVMEDARSRKPGMMQAPWFKVMITCCCVLLVVAVCIELYRRMENYGARVVEAHPVNARIEISNPPAWLDRAIVSSLLDESYKFAGRDEATYKRFRNVLDQELLSEIGANYTGSEVVNGKTVNHQAIGYNAWIRDVTGVHRELAKDGSVQTIQIFAQWRVPAAWVRVGDVAYLVDAQGTRLPGDYPMQTRNAGKWMTLTGLELPVTEGKPAVPAPGERWTAGTSGRVGDDFAAGMKLIAALQSQKYVKQIEAIDLTNYAGRKDAKASWITLATIWRNDAAGGGAAHVVQWGRPIGEEKFYDWQAPEKLKTLSEIYERFGRIDLGRDYVDIHAEGVRIPHLASQADQPAQFLRG